MPPEAMARMTNLIWAMTTQRDTHSVWHHLSCRAASCLTASHLSLLAALFSLSMPLLFLLPLLSAQPTLLKASESKTAEKPFGEPNATTLVESVHKTLTEGLPERAWL